MNFYSKNKTIMRINLLNNYWWWHLQLLKS